MENRALTIHVAPEAAQAYETASREERLKLDAILSRQLRAAMRNLRGGEEPDTARAPAPKRRLTARDLLESRLVGMWRERPEARDSAAFARALREKAQRR
jgi:hypothetical protein